MARIEDFSDYSLALAVGRFNQDALKEVYRRHGGAIYGVARRVTRNETLAEDVAQEVLLDLWNNPERFDPDRGSLRAYLLMRTHGRSVDLVRSEVARKEREERRAMRSAPVDYDLEKELMDLVEGESIRKALYEMDDKERMPIQLAYFQGLTYRQVARALNEPEGTVKSRIRAGLRRLRSALVEAGVQP